MPKVPKKHVPKVPKKHVPSSAKRSLIYPEVSVSICTGHDSLTCDQAVQLMGWVSESTSVKFHDDYLFKDDNGAKVRCTNNCKNRPFDESWARSIAQDILNKQWKLNLETVIIGSTGQVLSGQHRLCALILACQMWAKHDYWHETWDGEPTIDTLVAFGGDESEEFTRTLDNVKPRTLADVLFTSGMFSHHRPKDRKHVTRMLDYAIRLLWERTGASNNAFLPRRTHSEALEFISNHPSIVKYVNHIYEEDARGSLKKLMSLGYSSGLMYLMAVSASDYGLYADGGRCENALDMEYEEMSYAFWTELAVGNSLNAVKIAFTASDENDELIRVDEKIAMVCKAWNAFKVGEIVDDATVTLKYSMDDAGYPYLDEHPNVGGIDVN